MDTETLLVKRRLLDLPKGKRRIVDTVQDFPTWCRSSESLKGKRKCDDVYALPRGLIIENASHVSESVSNVARRCPIACVKCDNEAARSSFSSLPSDEKLKGVISVDEATYSREKIKEALDLYHKILTHLEQESDKKLKTQRNAPWILYCKAAKILFDRKKGLKVPKRLGPIPGVNVGDKFQSRAELKVIGLHHRFLDGIDFMKIDGKNFATSVVNSGRYENGVKSHDTFLYSGEGGNALFGNNRERTDQKLERGNLALKNNIEAKAVVRLIRSFQIPNDSKSDVVGISDRKLHGTIYVYDGLYSVDDYWQDRGKHGKLVFRFSLKRIPGQPTVSFGEQMSKWKGTSKKRDVVVNDISQRKEKLPIRALNAKNDEKPPSFDYITSIKSTYSFKTCMPSGCDCIDGCEVSKKCACAIKNGGAMPYDSKGCIVIKNPIVYECGPSCKCSSSCVSRVTQKGIHLQLEVSKTKSKKCVVKSRTWIPSGSFVCEFVGEVLHDKEAKRRINNHVREDGCLHFLSYPETGLSAPNCFTIDATSHANVGRFINHSCSPNLRAQNVLFDHEDTRMPHLMLFATKRIPPSQELTCDFRDTLAKFGM
ncbi:hypothetical protein UlMin_026592 [Ulmus minor]